MRKLAGARLGEVHAVADAEPADLAFEVGALHRKAAALVNEAFARYYFKDTTPLGKWVSFAKYRREDRFTIVGVLPPGFDLPFAAEVWVPLQTSLQGLPLEQLTMHTHDFVARLKPGVSVEQADAEAKEITRQLATPRTDRTVNG